MKKLLLITVFVCVAAISQAFAANPIPSYNVLVNGRAVFQESSKPIIGGTNTTKERRQMNVQTSVASPTAGFSQSIVVTSVYRLDGTIVLGPYYLVVGQRIAVGIDNQTWGVSVATDAARVSVWTTDQAAN
jgi:hypothetical protein